MLIHVQHAKKPIMEAKERLGRDSVFLSHLRLQKCSLVILKVNVISNVILQKVDQF